MDKYKKSIFIVIILLLLSIGFIVYKSINKSFGYFFNTPTARIILSNTSAFYYDRGSYIQYDDSYINNDMVVDTILKKKEDKVESLKEIDDRMMTINDLLNSVEKR